MRALAGQFLRFGVVGTIAFVIDAGVLWLAMGAGVDPYLARVISFVPAFAANFLLNRAWTFAQKREQRPHGQAARYLAVQLAGMAMNYAVFAAIVTFAGEGRVVALAAVVAGSIAAMGFNFLGARHLVFRPLA
ncbi:GtrA family protein [Qipengyuania spongiae]|uniref:GtrA family protein n=1 Tax=Qipengyuania spongiae TaxID=2909673 RepID=A0ABY5T3Y6_9SPHN|nr:GtrA family protein [Qipengyuania spongiae]UVI39694.1 GtrA family protein [Qipengyuania spongiae]